MYEFVLRIKNFLTVQIRVRQSTRRNTVHSYVWLLAVLPVSIALSVFIMS